MSTQKANRSRNRNRITTREAAAGRAVFVRMIMLFGQRSALAAAMKVHSSTLSKYERRWPAENVIAAERACIARLSESLAFNDVTAQDVITALALRRLTRHDIRPDIYPRDGGYDNDPPKGNPAP